MAGGRVQIDLTCAEHLLFTKLGQQQVNKMKPGNVSLGSQVAGCCDAISDAAGTRIPALLIKAASGRNSLGPVLSIHQQLSQGAVRRGRFK